MRTQLDWLNITIYSFIGSVAILIAVFIGDFTINAPRQLVVGQILDKNVSHINYVNVSQNLPVNNTPSAPVYITNYSTYQYNLVVRTEHKIFALSGVPLDLYYSVQIGDNVRINCKVGRVFGIYSSCKLEN